LCFVYYTCFLAKRQSQTGTKTTSLRDTRSRSRQYFFEKLYFFGNIDKSSVFRNTDCHVASLLAIDTRARTTINESTRRGWPPDIPRDGVSMVRTAGRRGRRPLRSRYGSFITMTVRCWGLFDKLKKPDGRGPMSLS